MTDMLQNCDVPPDRQKPRGENPEAFEGRNTEGANFDAGNIVTATLHFLQHAAPHQIAFSRLSRITAAGRQLVQKLNPALTVPIVNRPVKSLSSGPDPFNGTECRAIGGNIEYQPAYSGRLEIAVKRPSPLHREKGQALEQKK